MTRTIIATICCLPLAATAQTAAFDHYKSDLTGDYAMNGQCMGSDFNLTFADDYFNYGETTCTISDLQGTDDGFVRLIGTQCNAEGDSTDDRTIDLMQTGTPDGEIRMISNGTELLLLPCTDL
ncbi:hypothetical protein [Yoonia sp. 208BN28-4]|uniref:hypothetical protein n=1 Tax=Yoonia sp. 208BN28-4 TaxID=3126505 RepID=UPI0030A082D4